MHKQKSYKLTFILLFLVLGILFISNLSLGSVGIPFTDVLFILSGGDATPSSWNIIVTDFRLPKAITAVLVGAGLSVSGLLMQTLFRNPLAGPFVLGISSGASLGVALLILGAGIFGGSLLSLITSNWALAGAASIGSALVLLAVVLAAQKVRNTMSILIIGLMFGSITAAIISVLSYFSEAEQIQQYLFWSFGSLGNLSWGQLLVFAVLFVIGMTAAISIIKPLNSFLLGENYAKSLGIDVKKSRNIILIVTSLLTGAITAFAGPIAFIGLAVPHITKLVFATSNHKILLPAVSLVGAIILLICDSIAQLPMSEYTLPINAITSLFGAPVVIWLLVRKKKLFV